MNVRGERLGGDPGIARLAAEAELHRVPLRSEYFVARTETPAAQRSAITIALCPAWCTRVRPG